MRKVVVLAVVAVLVLVGSLVVRYFYRGSGAHLDLKPEQALGEVVAEESAKLLASGGSLLILAEARPDALLEAQIAAFQAALRKDRRVRGVAVERIKTMNPWLRTMNPGGSAYDADAFTKALFRHPQVNAVVSFSGLPLRELPELTAVKQRGGKIIAVFESGATPELTKAIENHLIDLAIVLREDGPSSKGASPKTARDYFDQYYVVLKPN